MNFYLDKKLEVSKDQEVLATVYSDSIKLADGGNAAGMNFDVRVKTAFLGAGGLVVGIQDSPDGTTWTTRVSSASFAAAALTKSVGGSPLLSLTVPKGHANNIRLAYTVTSTFTAGKVHAILNTEV